MEINGKEVIGTSVAFPIALSTIIKRKYMKLPSKSTMFYIVAFIVCLPFSYGLDHYLNYLLEKSTIDYIEKKNVVVIYDNFNSEHGDIVMQTFLNNLHSNLLDEYEVIKINQAEVRIEVAKLLVVDLLDQGKKVYMNASMSPTNGVYTYLWNLTYQDLAKYENITITQSVGNNLDTSEFLEAFTDKYKKLDNEIYTILNDNAETIKEIALIKDINQLYEKYGMYAQIVVDIQYHLGLGRNDKMREFVFETISPILSKYKLDKQQDEIVDQYTNIINAFAPAILMSDTNNKVIQVGSSSQSDTDIGTDSFLDFRVKNLINIDIRENAIVDVDGEKKVGTSLASPIALSNIINQLNTLSGQ